MAIQLFGFMLIMINKYTNANSSLRRPLTALPGNESPGKCWKNVWRCLLGRAKKTGADPGQTCTARHCGDAQQVLHLKGKC